MPDNKQYDFSAFDNIVKDDTVEQYDFSAFDNAEKKDKSTVNIADEDSIASKHNNPGNLIYAEQEGATRGEKRDDGTYWAKFENPQAGYEALKKDIEIKKSGKSTTGLTGKSTVKDFFSVYAPHTENETENYIKQVSDSLGISPETQIKDIDTDALAKEIARWESGTKIEERPLTLQERVQKVNAEYEAKYEEFQTYDPEKLKEFDVDEEDFYDELEQKPSTTRVIIPEVEFENQMLLDQRIQKESQAGASEEELSNWDKAYNSLGAAWGKIKAAPSGLSQAINIPLSWGDKGITFIGDKFGMPEETIDWLRDKYNQVVAGTELLQPSEDAKMELQGKEVPLTEPIKNISEQRASLVDEYIRMQGEPKQTGSIMEALKDIKSNVPEWAQWMPAGSGPSVLLGLNSENAGNFAAGAFDGMTGFFPSLAVGLSTAGVGFVPWLIGEELNRTVAANADMTDRQLSEVFEAGDDNTVTAITVGTLTGLLERYGFIRLTKYFGGKNITKPFARRFADLMKEAPRQGIINWLEAGLMHYNDVYNKIDAESPDADFVDKYVDIRKNDIKASVEAARFLFSDDGIDAGLKAMAGMILMGGPKMGLPTRFVPKEKAKIKNLEIAEAEEEGAEPKNAVFVEAKEEGMVMLEAMEKKDAEDSQKHLVEKYPNSEFEVVPIVDETDPLAEAKYTILQKSKADIKGKAEKKDVVDKIKQEKENTEKELLNTEAKITELESKEILAEEEQSELAELKTLREESKEKITNIDNNLKDAEKKVPELKTFLSEIQPTEGEQVGKMFPKKETTPEGELQKKETLQPETQKIIDDFNIKKEDAKAKIAEGFSGLAEAIGAKKSLVGEERQRAIENIQKIAEGLVEYAEAKGIELKQALGEFFDKTGQKVPEDLIDESLKKIDYERVTGKRDLAPEEKVQERKGESETGKEEEKGKQKQAPEEGEKKAEAGKKAAEKKEKAGEKKIKKKGVKDAIQKQRTKEEMLRIESEGEGKGVELRGVGKEVTKEVAGKSEKAQKQEGEEVVIPAETLSKAKKAFDKAQAESKLSEADAAVEAWETVKRSDWFKKLSKKDQQTAGAKFSEITERFTKRPTEKKKREKRPSEGTKVEVSEAVALRNQIRLEAKAATEGSKKIMEVKKTIADLINTQLKTKKIDEVTRGQVKGLLSRVKKANKDNIESVSNEVVALLDKIQTQKQQKDLIKNIKEALKTKTIKVERGIKKAKTVSKEVRTYLNKAQSIFNKSEQLLKESKLIKRDWIEGLKGKPLKLAEQDFQIQQEELTNNKLNEFTEWFNREIESINLKKLSDDAVVREQAIYEEIALRDFKNAMQRDVESLKEISENLNRTIKAGRAKLKAEIGKEIERRNKIKDFAREATTAKFSGKTKSDIQQELSKHTWKRLRYLSEIGRENFIRNFVRPITTTLDFIMKSLESYNYEMGEGPLYKYFMKGENGWMKNRNIEIERNREIKSKIRKNIQKKNNIKDVGWNIAKWSSIEYDTGIYLLDEQGNRSKDQKALSKNQGAYIYAISKMEGIKEKLAEQGWDETALAQNEKFIGKGIKDFFDWAQSEFLPGLYPDYNKTYSDIYLTPLDNINNFFPLLYDSFNRTVKEAELVIGENKFFLPGTIPNHVKSRVKNLNELSTTANAFETLFEYVAAMEKFNAYAKFTRDANILLTDPSIRHNMEKQSPSTYRHLTTAIKRAIGQDDFSEVIPIEKSIHKINRAVAFSKIAFRSWTALKQVLSAPAWWESANRAYVNIGKNQVYIPFWGTAKFAAKQVLHMNPVTAYKDHKFFMNKETGSNFYSERIRRGAVGQEDVAQWLTAMIKVSDPRKLFTTRQTYARKKAERLILKSGILANKIVDAYTIAVGGKIYYNQQNKQYRKMGLSEKESHKRAIDDFDLAFNLTQQSAETAFMSDAQMHKGAMKSLFAIFKNSQFSYFRKFVEGNVGLIEGYSRAKREWESKYLSEGLAPSTSKMRARRKGLQYLTSKNAKNNFKKIAIFGWVMPIVWQYVASGVPGILTEWDDDDTDEMIRALIFGPVDGMYIIGDLGEAAYDRLIRGKTFWKYQPSVLIDQVNETMEDVTKALEENGDFSWDVAFELARQMFIYKGGDINNLDLMYDGAVKLIKDGEWNQENIMKLLAAPKSLQEGKKPTKDEENPYFKYLDEGVKSEKKEMDKELQEKLREYY